MPTRKIFNFTKLRYDSVLPRAIGESPTVKRVLDVLLPDRLGRPFRWVWSSSMMTNLADGVMLAAAPVLVASLTREPFAVAMALFAQRLPWALFGVVSGAVVDRMDRRVLTIIVDIARASILSLLAIAIVLGYVNVALIYVAAFMLGTAEIFADTARSVLVAMTVPRPGLGLANARVFGGWVLMNQLVGPPVGALLFGVAIAAPFGFNAVCFAIAVALIAKVQVGGDAVAVETAGSVRRGATAGLRWLWTNPTVRTLAIMITVFNVTFGAAFSIWVLYAYERLGLNETGFGFLLTAGAIGGLVGSATFAQLEQRFRYATLLRVGLVVETATHLALGLTTSPLIAGGVMCLFGVHAVVWGTTSSTVRQRVVPHSLLGRVTSVYTMGAVGGLTLGTAIGGAIAQTWGVVAPFWFAGAGSAAMTALLWRRIALIARSADADVAEEDQPSEVDTVLDARRVT